MIARSLPGARLAPMIGVALLAGLQAPAAARTASPAPSRGALLIASDRQDGPPREMPLKQTAVRAYLAGYVAHVLVRQTFNNPFDQPLEAVYVFPLPESAAVSDMTIRVGDRTIRGEIKRREAARAAYEKARSEGKIAALLDQERPNVFTQSVANIEPHKEVYVEIAYDVVLDYEQGTYEFVYPMTVGPRYIPGTPNGKPPKGGGVAPDTDQVPDASRITPPLVKPERRSGRNVSVRVTIDPGMEIQKLESPTHEILSRPLERSHAVEVTLASAAEIPNKDFVLRYRLAREEPAMSVLSYRDPRGRGYFTMLFEPPAAPKPEQVAPKELYFVVDTSGSMSGEPMALVKRAMRFALRHLNPDDTFQIIRFSSSASQLGKRPLPNTPGNVSRALRYVDRLRGGGGTEMIRGIRAALDESRSEGRIRIVCFMTDGFIGNEAAILSEIEKKLGEDTRLFSFGVGSSPNRYLLERMAAVGRGEAHYMLLDEPPEEQVASFYRRVRSPVLTHIQLDWGRLDIESTSPERIPDLFAGAPLRLVGRFGEPGRGAVTVRGRLAGRPVEYRIPVDLGGSEEGGDVLARLWARGRIRELSSARRRSNDPDLAEKITRLGLEYRLVTRYTSFVAVDDRVANDSGRLRTYQVPVEVPEGVEYERVAPEADEEYGGAAGGTMAENIALKAPVTRSLGRPGHRKWLFGGGLSLGGSSLAPDDESALAGTLNLRVDRAFGPHLTVGSQLVLLWPVAGSAPSITSLLLHAALMNLASGWLHFTLGAGPAVPSEGGVGLGTAAVLEVSLPLKHHALQLRLDSVLGPEKTRSATGTIGLQVTF